MGESHLDLLAEYDAFLQEENARFQFRDRMSAAVSDYQHHSEHTTGAVEGVIRVPLKLSELRAARSSSLWHRLRLDPLRHIRALEGAYREMAKNQAAGSWLEKNPDSEIKVSLTGPVGACASSPRQLTSSCLRQLVCVEGVATKVSAIKPKVVKSAHYSQVSKTQSFQTYVDNTDPHLGLREIDAEGNEKDRIISITKSTYPTQDENGPLETEFGLCKFKDYQTISLQEMPEKAPMGQLPRSVELVLDHDLVDKIKPGDRVMIVGVYRALATAAVQGQQTSSGVFKTVVIVNSIQTLGRDTNQLNIELQDVTNMRALAKRKDILNILGRSLCPSIHGHEVIKKALALQLLSGVEKNLENGTHLRGDINILMVGDPSTAKSQLLRAAMTIAQLAVSTTGKGSSGVGLTAAVTSDPDTGERRLEAGAMVLADRGLVTVDEFDKMSENDRVAIHEAMEQQTVTIAKAGIHASLNARCSVLAAANPVYGQYDRRKRIQENIGLPDSLLSRFDLLFVVLDQMDPESDRRIASHVIRGHTYFNTMGCDSDWEDDDDDDEDALLGTTDKKVHAVWQRRSSSHNDNNTDVLQHDFLRKYLYFCKNRMQPILTDQARDWIAHVYAEMRARQDERTLPITARSLETVIRLATAHAKARLSKEIVEEDCAAAMEILSFALYHEQQKEPATVSDNDKENQGTDNNTTNDDDDDDTNTDEPRKRPRLDPTVVDERVLQLVWDRLTVEGTCAMEDLPSSNPEALQAALDQLVQQGRIHVADGMVYSV